jgi:hypothetical protein
MDNIQKWAAEVINTFSPLAEKVDLAFYPLQSEVKLSPKVLFLGLNPGGNHSYRCQKENDNWDFIDRKTMSVARLLAGNPTFDSAREKWPIIRGLKTIPFLKDVLNEGNFCMMNYYYMNTSNFNTVLGDSRLEEMLEISKAYTFKFIDLIKPEMIIVLGTGNGIDRLQFTDKKTVLNGISLRLLVKSQYKDIPVLAIPHPSRMMLQAVEIKALDQNIRETCNHTELTKFAIPSFRSFSEPDINNINHLLNHTLLHFGESKGIYDCVFSGIGNDKLLLRIVVKSKERYWGLRAFEPINHDWYNHLKYGEVYRDAISGDKDYCKDSWVVLKKIRTYGATSQIELERLLAQDIINLTKAIQNYSTVSTAL